MKDLVLACLVTIVLVFVYGFVRGDRMRLTHVDEERPKRFTLVVSVPDISEQYDTLRVYSCAADVTENGVFCREDGRETASAQAFRLDKKQYSFPFPPPRGTVRFMAVALDRDARVLANSQLTLMRGF